MNFTNFTLGNLNESVIKVDSYAQLIRLNCGGWSDTLLRYGIVLILVGVVFKIFIDYNLLQQHPKVRESILTAGYVAVIVIGVILVAMRFL